MYKDKTNNKDKITDKGKTTIITTIMVGVFITLIGSIFSPVFSPLNEIIKDGLLGQPDTNITSAMTFSYVDKKVTRNVDANDVIPSHSITFNFTFIEPSNITPMGRFLLLLGMNNYFSFECSIDGRPFEECMSPKIYTNLDTEIDHIFQVRAKSILGNFDKFPAIFTFTSIPSASVKGVIKENATVYASYSNITLDADSEYPTTTVTNERGQFLFQGVGKGTHIIEIFLKKNDSILSFSDTFFVPGEETVNLDIDLQNFSKIDFINIRPR